MAGFNPRPWTRWMLRQPVRLYDWHAGWVLGRRFLLLTHVGRRSGRRYRTALEVIGTHPGTGEILVMSGFGRTADWFRNVLATPPAELEIGRERFVPVARELPEDEAVAAFAAYEQRNRWMAPIMNRVLTRMLGWPYDGSDEARRKTVHELPIVGFRPADTP